MTRGLDLMKNGCLGNERVGFDEEQVLRQQEGWI